MVVRVRAEWPLAGGQSFLRPIEPASIGLFQFSLHCFACDRRPLYASAPNVLAQSESNHLATNSVSVCECECQCQ